jgi:hypothetical protein
MQSLWGKGHSRWRSPTPAPATTVDIMPVFLGTGLRSFESSSPKRDRLENRPRENQRAGSQRKNKPQIPRESVIDLLRLHCQDGAKSGLALCHAIVGLRCLSQRVGLHNRFNFSLRYEIKRFVKIFGAVLLAADDSNAL